MTCSSPSSMERLNYDRSLLRNSMECYSPLERAIKYSNSKVVLQRLVLIREFIDICHDVGYSKATTTLLPILRRLIKDNEEEVKKGALNILGNLVGFLVQSDPDKGYKTVITNIVPIIKNVLIGNDDPSISISIKEAACQACITLCSHLRHIDRVQSILSISLALANDLENDDSRCLAAWMLNGLAEYVGKDICKQFIIPQIKCLADDHSERVRKFTAMNLCEIIRINQDFNDLLPIFKRIISFDTNSVRLYAIKVLLGVSSSLKNISNEEFASSLITIQENCVELNLRLEYLKQLGPLITLFPNTELIPSQILDLFLTMDQLSIIEDNVNLNENNARFSDEFSENNIDDNDDNIMHANNGINDNMHVSNNNNDSINNDNMNNDNINNDNINNDNNLINNNSNINVRLISSNIEEVRGGLEDMITLIPFGNQLGLTFKKLESNDPAYFCSYSFASVFSHMGSKYWPAFSDLLSRLVGNSHHFVRLPIAASMPLILATALSCCEYSHLQNNNLNVHSNFNLNNIDSIKFNNSKIESTTSVFNENMEINLNERIKSENNTGNIQNEFNNTINTGIDLFYNNITKFPAKSIISGTVFKLPCSKGCLYKFDRLPFLLDIIGKLFEDDDIFVKRAICGCLSDIIKCLPLKQQIESVIRKFPDLLNSCKNDWRCRNILANQIRKICIELHIRNKEISKQENSSDNLFTGKYAQDYISPVAFSLLLDPVSTVRSTAINCISSLLRLSSPFLWHFFQNGGNIQDLPSPINSTPMSAIEKQDEKTFNFSNLNLNNNSDLQNGSLKNNSNLNDHINYNNCQSLQIHKQQTSTISYSSIYNPSPSSSKSLGKCNSNQFNENKSNYDVKLKTLFSMDEDNNCKLLNELALIWCILKTFAISTKYHHRQEYIKMCDRFIRDIPRKFFYTYFLNPLILLTSDPVKNVRTTWLRVIGPHIKDTGRLAQCANIIAACKLMNLTEVDNECNKYFSNIKFLPKNTLKRVEFLSMKEITNIIERTSQYDDILNWNQQPLIKHFNLYLEEVVGSLWCLDNVPGSNILTTSTSNYNSKKPFYSTEKCSDLTMEYEMMLLEVRPNSSPTNLNTLAPVITTDTNILEYGPYNDSIPNNYSMFSCRLGITRRSSEINETDSNSNNDQSLSESLAILHRPGIPRSYAKFICPIGTDITYNNDQPIYSEIKKVNIGENKKTESTNFSKEKILIFDHKLHEATRKIFMVDIARAATDDLF